MSLFRRGIRYRQQQERGWREKTAAARGNGPVKYYTVAYDYERGGETLAGKSVAMGKSPEDAAAKFRARHPHVRNVRPVEPERGSAWRKFHFGGEP